VEREAPRPAQARARVGAIKKNGLEAIENSNGAAWETLRSIWQRPWLDDQNADRAAFTKACHEADPAVIIAAARTWVETVDEPRYLQPLAKWLGNRGWEKEPPKRGRGNRQMSTAEAAYLAGHYPDGTPRDEEAS